MIITDGGILLCVSSGAVCTTKISLCLLIISVIFLNNKLALVEVTVLDVTSGLKGLIILVKVFSARLAT